MTDLPVEPKPIESASGSLEQAIVTRPVSQTTSHMSSAPPSLEYSLHTRKRSIAIFWTLIVVDSVAMPIVLYFGLLFGTSLSPNALFSIVTAALGGVSIVEYVWRFWKLVKNDSDCRCDGAERKHFDWFHWTFSFMWFFVIVELIVGTCFDNPPIRLLSMPLATVCYVFGSILIVHDTLHYLRVPSPVRISSQPKGSILRPAIYPFIEDIVAVDGGGGTAFRHRLSYRYEASHVFRQLLSRLSLFWGLGAESAALLTTILVFTLPKNAAYVVGWSLPFVWAGLWVLATVWYVRRMLRVERDTWHLDTKG